MVREHPELRSTEGRLGVLLPGMGAVATTTIAGVHLARKELAQPIGSLTQLNTIRLGQRTEERTPLIKDFIGLAALDDIVFGGWDPIPDKRVRECGERRRSQRKAPGSHQGRPVRRYPRWRPLSTRNT